MRDGSYAEKPCDLNAFILFYNYGNEPKML